MTTVTPHAIQRKRLTQTRNSMTAHHEACGLDYYVIVSFYDDTLLPGEVFVKVAKEGSDIAGWVDAWAVTTSLALQYGVPWGVLFEKAQHHRFGINDNENPSLLHAIATSIDLLIQTKAHIWTDEPNTSGGASPYPNPSSSRPESSRPSK